MFCQVQSIPNLTWGADCCSSLDAQMQSCHTSSQYPTLAPSWRKGLISNMLHFALNLWMILPLPTSQTFFTFSLLLGCSVLLQTPECSEYHPFAQSRGQRSFSYQAPTTWNFPLLSITHPLSVPSNLPWKPFSFWKLFLQSPCPEVPVCVRMCVCVYKCACIWLLFMYLNFWHPNMYVRFVSA